jgi:Ca2+-binding EF-hand superfamily protein
MEYSEMQEAFNTMLAPANVDISAYEGESFTPAKFKRVAELQHTSYPQYNVAGNLMKYIRENAEAADDDGQEITDKALQKVFSAYDKDGSGELSILEMFKLFEYLKIRLKLVFEQKGCEDGSVTFEEFCTIVRNMDEQYPGDEIDEKIMGLAANLGEGAPDVDDQPDPDPDNDPAEAGPEETEPANKKALLVGINYIGSSCELGGCINDVRNEMKVLTENYGFSEDNILLLTEDQDDDSKLPTAQNIRDGFTWLLDGAAEGDFLFFAYSGHGSQLPDQTGNEPDGKKRDFVSFGFAGGLEREFYL